MSGEPSGGAGGEGVEGRRRVAGGGRCMRGREEWEGGRGGGREAEAICPSVRPSVCLSVCLPAGR